MKKEKKKFLTSYLSLKIGKKARRVVAPQARSSGWKHTLGSRLFLNPKCWWYSMHACSVVSDSLQPHGLQPTRLFWNFPGKNIGMGYYFFLQGNHRDWTCVLCVSCIGRWILYHWATRKVPVTQYVCSFCKTHQVDLYDLCCLLFSKKLTFLKVPWPSTS